MGWSGFLFPGGDEAPAPHSAFSGNTQCEIRECHFGLVRHPHPHHWAFAGIGRTGLTVSSMVPAGAEPLLSQVFSLSGLSLYWSFGWRQWALLELFLVYAHWRFQVAGCPPPSLMKMQKENQKFATMSVRGPLVC